MTQSAQSTFAISSWNETPFDELEDGSKLSRASIVKSYEGSLSGQGKTEQLASYLPDGSGQFSAIERFRGSLDGREGTFVFHHVVGEPFRVDHHAEIALPLPYRRRGEPQELAGVEALRLEYAL